MKYTKLTANTVADLANLPLVALCETFEANHACTCNRADFFRFYGDRRVLDAYILDRHLIVAIA